MTIAPIQPNLTKSTPTRVPTLTLVLDPGTSCIKTIYCKGRRGQPKYQIDTSLVCPTSSPSAGESYIKLPHEQQYYLVGRSASFSKLSISIKQLKSESIIPKILGVIGKVAKRESLPEQFNLRMHLLLPISEINDREYIESDLVQALASFNYSGIEYKVKTTMFVAPEGRGVYSYISRFNLSNLLENEVSSCLMFGYRNTSLLLFESGCFNLKSSHSTDLGFYNYLDLVAHYSSGLYRDDIQKAIVTEPSYGSDHNCRQVITGFTSHIRIEDLIRSSSPKHRERERNSIQAAIARADEEYWQLLSRWLQEKLPPMGQLDRVIYCGGSTSFIESSIKEFFKDWKGSLLNTNQMSLKMMDKLEIAQPKQKNFINQYLPIRLADAWGEFVDLANVKL